MPTTTFRTDQDKIEKLDALAQALGRSRNWVLNKAVDDLLEYQEWFMNKVEEGIQDDKAGNYAPPEAVEAIFQKHGA